MQQRERIQVSSDKFTEIHESYSGDTIGESKTIRRPFKYGSKWHVSTGGWSGGREVAEEETYQLVPRAQFSGEATFYGEIRKGADEDWAANRRAQPEGFYHGMLVKRANAEWVLVGPPLVFVAKEGSFATKQLALL